MKKTSNVLSKMLLLVAFVGFAGTASAQSDLNAGGVSTNDFTCSIGNLVVGENTGFLGSLAGVPTGVRGIYVSGDVQIQSAGDGKITVVLPENLVAEGAFYSIYDFGGALINKADITGASTTIETASIMNGKPVIISVATRKSGKLTSVKLVK